MLVKLLYKAVIWLRRLVAGLSPRRPGFAPWSVHVGFVVDKMVLGKVCLRVPRFSHVNFGFSIVIYHLGGMNNRPVGGRSSET
jgi:hypothetical protein